MTVFEVHPKLLPVAEAWPVYEDTQVNGGNGHELAVVRSCTRCVECDCVVVGEGVAGRAYHLMTHHGYRMNGERLT